MPGEATSWGLLTLKNDFNTTNKGSNKPRSGTSAGIWQLVQWDPPPVQLVTGCPPPPACSSLNPVFPCAGEARLSRKAASRWQSAGPEVAASSPESAVPAQDGGHVKAQLAEYLPVFHFYDLAGNQEQDAKRHVTGKQAQQTASVIWWLLKVGSPGRA